MEKMRPVALLDFAFFALETLERTSNVGPLMILKLPAGIRSAKNFADRLMANMRKCPVGAPFNMRYVAPGLQGLPHFEQVDVTLSDHCERRTLPSPGTDAQLFEMVCRIHEQKLDRSRPLWAFYIIDGLQGNRVAVYAKVHHGTVDGKGMVELCTRWLSQDSSEKKVRALWEGLPGSVKPRKEARIATLDKAGAFRERAVATAKVLQSFSMALVRQAASSSGLYDGLPLPFIKTPKVLQSFPSVRRSFSYCVLPVSEMKEVGKIYGASVNDVLLAVLDIAVNRHLNESGASIDRDPLVADMPIALAKTSGAGNAVALLQIALGSAAASPQQRLRQIMKRTAEAKIYAGKTDSFALMAYTAVAHGIPAALEMVGLHKAPMLANLVISNPFGMPHKCYLAGAEVEMALPVSVLLHGQSLNITAVTYDKGLQIAFLGLEAELPDIQRLADYTVLAFDELKAGNASAQ